MPRKPTYQHDFTKRTLNPLLDTVHREDRVEPPGNRESHLVYQLRRADSRDSLLAAKTTVGGENWRYIENVDEILDTLQHWPLILALNWYSDFDHPKKHPFQNAQREYFFIGENLELPIRGSWHFVVNGYYRARDKREWIRLQNCWGHDYPLVWLPVATLRDLWDRNEAEALVAV